MNGLCSVQFAAAAAEKPAAPSKSCLICPTCNATSCRYSRSNTRKNPGRFFYKCPASDHNFFKWADQVKDHELIQVPHCGGCDAGVCRVKRESAGPNAGRILFMCRVKEGDGSCGYRVWKDELEKSETGEMMDPLKSGMVKCINTNLTVTDMAEESKQRDEGADLVSPLMEPSDDVICSEVIIREMDQFQCVEGKSNTTSRRPHKRSCHGEGSCSYRVWQDEPETSDAKEIMYPFQSGIVKCNKANITITDTVHIKEGGEGTHPISPFIEPSDDVICREVISQNHEALSCKRDQLNCAEGKYNATSRSPHKRSRYEDIIATPDGFENCCGSITQSRNSKGIESYRKLSFNVEQHHSPIDSTYVRQENTLINSSDALASTRSLLGAESYSKSTTHGIVSNSISNELHKAAKCIQDELLARLEMMDAKDHEAMSKEAEATFAALDRLAVDYEDFKKHVKELINCASQLVEINLAMPTNDSFQRLVEVCSSDRERLDLINCVHAEGVEAETNSKKRIRLLQEEISSTKARLSQLEAEVSCCEVEKISLELELEKISKNKVVSEGKYLMASKQVEESQKLLEQKETEQNVAKAKFNRARALHLTSHNLYTTLLSCGIVYFILFYPTFK